MMHIESVWSELIEESVDEADAAVEREADMLFAAFGGVFEAAQELGAMLEELHAQGHLTTEQFEQWLELVQYFEEVLTRTAYNLRPV